MSSRGSLAAGLARLPETLHAIDAVVHPCAEAAARPAMLSRAQAASGPRRQATEALCGLLRSPPGGLAHRPRHAPDPVVSGALRTRGPPLWEGVRKLLRAPPGNRLPAMPELVAFSGARTLAGSRGIILGVLTLAAVLLALAPAWRLLRGRARASEGALAPALLAELGTTLPLLAGLTAGLTWLWLSHAPGPPEGIEWLLAGSLCYVAGHILIRGVFAPPYGLHLALPLDRSLGHTLARGAQAALALALITALVGLTPPLRQPEGFYLTLRGILVTLLSLALARLLFLLGRVPSQPSGAGLVRRATIATLAGTVLMEWLGYREAAAFLLRGSVGTLLGVSGFWIVGYGLKALLHELETGHRPWQARIRQALGIPPGEPLPGIQWLRAAIWLAAWIGFVLLLLEVWGLPHAGTLAILRMLNEGIPVGGTRVVPLRVIEGLVAFAVLLTATRWARDRIQLRLSASERLDRGAREAAVTLAGYAGFTVAAVVALGLAGLGLANLALIAGALSVGIGFGLQNIVNNFVSGLILLFERPIRPGDYVTVGTGTEGFVRRISIRSTEIETLDRTNVVVPNSELISGQVTNWMLNDRFGRIIVRIGVAYGSDVRLVERLLLNIAEGHPDIISEADLPPPTVFFRGFGDSSLDFELRATIRDISQRFRVSSEVNFAIDAAFREHGVQIPFPQRDLHLRTVPDDFSR